MGYKPSHSKTSAARAAARGAAVVGAAAIAAAGAAAIGAGPADAATPAVTATTYVANHPDSGGHGNNWAYDDFTRMLTVTRAANSSTCTGVGSFDPSADTCYTAAVSDNGKFNAIVGTDVPNGADNGQITHAVQGTMTGTAFYTLYAPATDAPTGKVASYQNDNFTSPSGDQTSSDWPAQAFATPADVTVQYDSTPAGGPQSDWSYTYTDTCEKWTDAGTSGGGTGPDSKVGDITGQDVCVTSHSGPGFVLNFNSDKVLDVTGGVFASGTVLQQWREGAKSPGGVFGGDQQFELENLNNGTSWLVTTHNGTTYYVTAGAQGSPLTLSTHPGAGAVIVKKGAFYTFPDASQATPTLVMDVTGRSRADGAKVQGYAQQSSNNANQQWTLP